jgi:hypothetical protein
MFDLLWHLVADLLIFVIGDSLLLHSRRDLYDSPVHVLRQKHLVVCAVSDDNNAFLLVFLAEAVNAPTGLLDGTRWNQVYNDDVRASLLQVQPCSRSAARGNEHRKLLRLGVVELPDRVLTLEVGHASTKIADAKTVHLSGEGQVVDEDRPVREDNDSASLLDDHTVQ